MTARTALFRALSALLPFLAGCQPGYLIRAAVTEADILLRRRPIREFLESGTADRDEARSLPLVLAAREFSTSRGLDPGGAFLAYSRFEGEAVTWVVVAARPVSFEFYTRWYPFVGSVPYQGFFERADADAAARRLEAMGYETSVRGAEAFSTLGWFDDPVLTPLLRHPPGDVVNTVIHESVHSTLWVPGQVDFNESLATFVAAAETPRFFALRGEAEREEAAREAAARLARVSSVVEALYDDLATLFRSPVTEEEKRRKKKILYARHGSALGSVAGTLFDRANNAELLQLKLYVTGVPAFGRLYGACGNDLRRFLEAVRSAAETPTAEGGPFTALRNGAACE